MIPCPVNQTEKTLTDENLLFVSWARVDGQPMPTSYRIENNNELVFPHVQREFAGKYKCVVEDIFGKQFISIVELKVGGKGLVAFCKLFFLV